MWKLILLGALVHSVNLIDVTFYEILGVSKQATTQEIRQAYKKLVIKYHPDKNPGSAEQEKFIKITEAYETLKDPDKRHSYDAYGSFPTYTRKYDHHSQSEYNNLFYNGLYHDDPYVDTLSGGGFYNYLQEGFHFINFYSPFCPPCQNLADSWKKLAETYKGIVKVGAVNCKYYNSFCYNSMRIGSYPSLLFYPNGKNGNYIYYRGDRTYDALEQFVINYIRNQVHVPTLSQIKSTDHPIAYVLGSNRIEEYALTRISYHLKGLVTLAVVEDDSLREKLTDDESVTVVFKYKGTTKPIHSTDEREIVKEVIEALPEVEAIGPEEFKKIRSELRSGDDTPWVLYFSTEKDNERLHLHQMRISHPEMRFAEIDCLHHPELCASLQVPPEEAPAWGVLKPGGAYQRVFGDARANVPAAARAARLHSLSVAEMLRVMDGEAGTWVLLVAPHKLAWDHMALPFARASMRFPDEDDISFGIMSCTQMTDKYCRMLANEPSIVVQEGPRRHSLDNGVDERAIVDFVNLLRETADIELTEQQVMEILDASSRDKSWLVAFMPAQCGRLCETLTKEWRVVAKKLRPLERVRVRMLQCAMQSATGLCANVRAPTARLYPATSKHHYTVGLQQLSQWPYMAEWALEYLAEEVQRLTWHTFSRQVVAEELNPSSGKKPWLVYFHSPRCYRCYEMYADFVIAGKLLNKAVHLGRVNCVNERGLCQHEQIMSYPTLRLYLGRNQHHSFSSIIPIPVKDYDVMLREIRPHIRKYDKDLLAGLDEIKTQRFQHDEF